MCETTPVHTTEEFAQPHTAERQKELKTLDQQHQLHGFYHPHMEKALIIWASGEGTTLVDVEGNKYIDALGGLTVNAIGHSRKDVADVAYKQMQTLEFALGQRGYSNTVSIKTAEQLANLAQQSFPGSDLNYVMFTSGGSEANEAAYHLALRYWQKSGGLLSSLRSKKKLISFRGCYHGTTFTSASAKPEWDHYGWRRLVDQGDKLYNMFVSIEFPHHLYLDSSHIQEGETVGLAAARQLRETIEREGAETVAAFIAEPIQGDGGVVIPHDDFWPLARKICDEYGVLLITDEVMTFGKTGKWFAMEHWNTVPDMITISKGLTSGYLPLGALIVSQRIKEGALERISTKLNMRDLWQHDYTWSGHPTCCAVALKNLEVMEKEGVIEMAAEKGALFLSMLKEKLKDLSLVREVRGKGIMIGIDLNAGVAADVELKLAHEYHIIAHGSSNMHCLTMTPSPYLDDQKWTAIVNALYEILSSPMTHLEAFMSKWE